MIDAYVIGSDLPALAAALELAEVGLRVRIAGGPVAAVGGDGVAGAGAQAHGAVGAKEAAIVAAIAASADPLDRVGVRDPEGGVAALIERIAAPIAEGGARAADIEPVREAPRPVLLRTAKGEWRQQPVPAVWGIPTVPMAEQALEFLGGGAATRAMLDRVKPVLTIGKVRNIEKLVRSRLGRAVAEQLVDPLVRERFGAGAADVDVAIASPGLNEALTRAGSLSGAALALEERTTARETTVAPAQGWASLSRAARARLGLYAAEFAEHAPVSVRPHPTAVSHAAGEGHGDLPAWVIEEADGAIVEAHALVWCDPLTETPGESADAQAPVAGPGAAGLTGRITGTEALFADLEAALDDAAGREARATAWCAIATPDGEAVPDDERPALQTVVIAGGDAWSVRTEATPSGWIARAAGPRIPNAQRPAHAAAEAAAREAIAAAGATPVGELRVRVGPAHHAHIATRDAESEALARWREAHANLLVTGASLHGDSVSAAAVDGREEAIALRRRLTGIAD